jgi:type III restriction enzyme
VEVKMEREMVSVDVKGKQDAARRWANHVSADADVAVAWRYLLASESDVETARGSWRALRTIADS